MSVCLLLLITALVAALCYYTTRFLLRILEKAIMHTSSEWDDDLVNNRLLRAVSQLAPAICVRWMLPGFFSGHEKSYQWLSVLTSLYILIAAVRIVTIFIDNLYEALLRRERTHPYAVKGVFQMFKLIIICVGAIVGLSIVIGRSPLVIITALGASAAVLMLVFKDTILGLVASIQLTANKMLQRGDWIIVESRDINGEVLDVSLTTIKIKNWDNSVSTIPPYTLVSESFRNYQPMRDDGARRIERAIYIDVNSVRFLREQEIESLRHDGLLSGIDQSVSEHSVNLTLLRNYLEEYLMSHPLIDTDMICMVRQLAPTTSGLPLQLYCFTKITEWKSYERVQSDLFDYIYAVVRRFGLVMFQAPTGRDIEKNKN